MLREILPSPLIGHRRPTQIRPWPFGQAGVSQSAGTFQSTFLVRQIKSDNLITVGVDADLKPRRETTLCVGETLRLGRPPGFDKRRVAESRNSGNNPQK
jgi:hypothetical protein